MSELYTIPSTEDLASLSARTPDYMRPNTLPYAAVAPGYLSDVQCDSIIETYMKEEPYNFTSCGATTRECPRPLDSVLELAVYFTNQVNKIYWQYALDEYPAAWLQTYKSGDSYKVHMDCAAGQSRKLTAVIMLTDSKDYEGGDLRFVDLLSLPKVEPRRGTIVVFSSWLRHEVTPLTRGFRQTINLGFHGPPFI